MLRKWLSVGLGGLLAAAQASPASAQSAPINPPASVGEQAKAVERTPVRARIAAPGQERVRARIAAPVATPGQDLFRARLDVDPHHGELAARHAKVGVACANCHMPNPTSIDLALPGFAGRLLTTANDLVGLTTTPADPGLCSQLGLGETKGLVVTKVVPNSVASDLGLHVSDLLLKVGDKELKAPNEFRDALASNPKQETSISLIREGKPRTIEVSVDTLKKVVAPGANLVEGLSLNVAPSPYWIGVSLAAVDETMRSHLKLKEGAGVLAATVVEGSPAAKAGLKTHDVVLEIDGKPIGAREALIEAVQKSEGKPLKLELIRAGKHIDLEIKPEKRPADQLTGTLQGPTEVARVAAPLSMLTRVRPGVVVDPNMAGNPVGAVRRLAPAPTSERDELAKKLDRLSDQLEQLEAAVRELKAERRGATPKR